MAARRTITSALTALAIGLALLAGCTPADPNLQPTYSCTPDDGSSPYPCARVQYDAKAKEAALYAEAEQVYRKYLAEHERIHRIGGITEATPVLIETTTSTYFESALKAYQQLKSMEATATGGQFLIAWIHRAPGRTMPGSDVAIEACIDTSSVAMGSTGVKPKPGLISQQTAYFTRVDGALKISDSDVTKVAKC